ncbi:hypothetical protein AWW67_15000 [Roseivirga seohaensis]|uniref:Lipoprotein n=1 Tax=Roseivirga seohaensis TaxID=1914963 RepID=A0A150Y373_9BACT|nr:hypothetical protein [Roseivirga seohaensis]KYG85437.1 hypothetical protein AWW67_15000 [Roseivirga seohaensis]
MKTKTLFFLSLLLVCLIQSCGSGTTQETTDVEYGNPPAEGFNLEGSDPKAIEVADQVMEAMGGRKAWDNTRHIAWNFFGARDLVWDKWTGDVRIDMRNTTFLININDNTGKAFIDGREITDSDTLNNLIGRGKSAWINDSYWLLMPFKLKDSGVTLKYLGEEKTNEDVLADKLELTFDKVGNTPNNRYWVWVDKTDHLVKQWAYYRNAADTTQGFNVPFRNYQKMGNILISGDRGERQLTNIMVFDELPSSVYKSKEKPDLAALKNQ